MGDAKRRLVAQQRLLSANKLVKIDLSQPFFAMDAADRAALESTGEPPAFRAAKTVIGAVVNLKFKDGMDRKVGRLWAGWQEVLCLDGKGSEPDEQFEVMEGQLEWLRGHLADEELKIAPQLAQWRETLVAYFESLAAGGAEAAPGGEAAA